MKKSFTIFFILIFLFACKDSDKDSTYLINGYITGYFQGKVVLSKYQNGKMINIDSVYMTKSKFKFEDVRVDYPELHYLIIDDGKIIIEFFMDKSHIQINADYNNQGMLEVQGSEPHNEYVSFLENNIVYENKQKEIYEQKDLAKLNNDTAFLSQLDSIFSSTYQEQMNFIYSYVLENKKSFVSVFIASRSLADHVSLKELEKIAVNFEDTVKPSVYYKELTDKIEVRTRTQEGMQAPDFSLQDTSGASISLSSLQGKYVLLDFSASWHGPSRSRNPKINKLYKKFMTKDFEIFQVGFERSEKEWKGVIKVDGIDWISVSDVEGLESEVIKLYGIRTFPKSFLLDKQGVIISRDISVEELDLLLTDIL